MTAPSGELWSQLAFRDHLRRNPKDATAYAALKRELAQRHHGDREAYTSAEGEFIRALIPHAEAWEAV